MTDNHKKFTAEFNTLNKVMKDKAKKTKFKEEKTNFDALRQHLCSVNETVKYYEKLIISINTLRNTLTHEEDSIEYVLAEPSLWTIERIINIRKKIINPDTASLYCTNEVCTFNLNDTLIDVLKVVNEKQISQFPLFANNQLRGILSDNGITNWLATKIDNNSVTLKDIALVTLLEEARDEDLNNYKIIQPSTLLYDVVDIFSEKLKEGKTSFIILISENKKIKHPNDVLGIITPWDLQNIKNTLNV